MEKIRIFGLGGLDEMGKTPMLLKLMMQFLFLIVV